MKLDMPERMPTLRDAVNVADLKERDRLVRRIRRVRKLCVEIKQDTEHWNRSHPDEQPLSTRIEDAMIAYYDGESPWDAVEAAYLACSVSCPRCNFVPTKPRGEVGQTCVWCQRGKYVGGAA